MELTIVTPTIPEREDLLAQAVASVQAQTVQPVAHFIEVDDHHMGPAVTLNSLLMQVETPWVMMLDDDDILYPNHIETLASVDTDASVIYTMCDFEGDEWLPYLEEYDYDRLMVQSIVPNTAAFKTELWNTYGGLNNRKGHDWDFWKRLARGGEQFEGLDDVTWLYRFSVRPGHINDSRGDIRDSFLKKTGS